MKQFLLSLLFLVVTTSVAQDRYSIYSLNGDIMYKSQYGLRWTKSKKKDPLHLADSLKIPQDGKVSILDNNTCNVYYSLHEGAYKVKTIITDALLDKNALMKRLNEELISTITTTNPNRISYRPIGGVKLGNSSLEDSIASFLYSYMKYGKFKSRVMVNNQLLLRKIYSSRDYLTFEITNCSSKGYYYNIARIDRNKNKIYICYNISEIFDDEALELSLFIPMGETISFNEFPFAVSKKDEYVLFAVDKEFSVETLQSILDKGDEKPNENTNSANFCVGVELK